MAAFWPSPAISREPHAHGALIAEAIRNAANIANAHFGSLSDLLRRMFRKQRPSTPLLRFSDEMADENASAEAPPWDGYEECGAAGLEMALHVNELHSAAAKCLDAADYALARLRDELAAVAPGLLGSSLDNAAYQSSGIGQLRHALPYMRGPVSNHRGLVAA